MLCKLQRIPESPVTVELDLDGVTETPEYAIETPVNCSWYWQPRPRTLLRIERRLTTSLQIGLKRNAAED
jgi:hypothetical protein